MTGWLMLAAVFVLLLMCGRLYDQVHKLRLAAARGCHLEIIVAELIESQQAELRGAVDEARQHVHQARNAYITLDAAGRV